ncbi:MAG: DMT family transporter [Alphaproteobacteria bacterium]
MTGAAEPDRPLRGVAFIAVAFACLGVSDALAKAGLSAMSIAQMLSIRSLIVLALLLPWAALAGGLAVLRTRKPRDHAIRVAWSIASMACFFGALRHLELATAIAIGFVSPLIMTALSVPMLGERVGVHRWAAIAIGFAGALVIVQPGADGFQPAALLCLAAAAAWAVSMVYVRRLSRTDGEISMMVFQNAAVLVVMAAIAPFGWTTPAAGDVLLVAGMAAAIVAGQWFMFRAFRHAQVGLVAPLQYSEIVWATILGWIFWREFPEPNVWAGTAILVASGLYVIWRERVRAAAADGRAAPG